MTARPKRFNIGEMRHRINIQSPTETVADTGQPVISWSTVLASEPAKFDPISGNEVMRGRQLESQIKAVFTIHRREGIVPEMQVVHNGNAYGIVYVHEVEGNRRYLEIQCKR